MHVAGPQLHAVGIHIACGTNLMPSKVEYAIAHQYTGSLVLEISSTCTLSLVTSSCKKTQNIKSST